MIIVLTPTEAPRLIDLDRFDRLHAEVHGELGSARIEGLCRPGDDEHVWLDIATARREGAASADDPGFADRFDAMIAFARDSGWVDDDGTHVRAHVEPGG